MRTIPNIGSLFQPLEDAIRLQLLPSITGHVACTTSEHDLFSLPCRFGGLGVDDLTNYCDSQFDTFLKFTIPLKDLIISQSVHAHPPDTRSIKDQVHQHWCEASKEHALEIRDGLSPQLQRAFDLNGEPGASSWLLALPLQDQGFHLTKQEFWDALRLRYGWTLLNTPSHCACGQTYTTDHVMICQHDGLTFVHHNDLRDITAELLSNVCNDVAIELPFQPLSGEVLTSGSEN